MATAKMPILEDELATVAIKPFNNNFIPVAEVVIGSSDASEKHRENLSPSNN